MKQSKAVTINGKVAEFSMGIKSDANKDRDDRVIRVHVDFTDVKIEDMAIVVFSGASFRVRLQSYLRSKYDIRGLDGLEKTGFKGKWLDIIGRARIATAQDILAGLSLAQFVKTINEQYGLETEMILPMYSRKHGIPLQDVLDEWDRIEDGIEDNNNE